MNSLKNVLEGILSSDFDITEKDINFMQEFVQNYRSKSKRYGSYYIKPGWDWTDLGKIVNNHYGRFVGWVSGSDFKTELIKIHNKNESMLIISGVDSDPSFYIFVPHGRKKWMLYANDPFTFNATLFKETECTDDEVLVGSWVKHKSYVYALESDKLLKDIQDELK